MSHLKKALEKAKAERSILFFGERIGAHKLQSTRDISRIFDSLSELELETVPETSHPENSTEFERSPSAKLFEFPEIPEEISYSMDVHPDDDLNFRHTRLEDPPGLNDIQSEDVFAFRHTRWEETPANTKTPAASFDSKDPHPKDGFPLKHTRLEEAPKVTETPVATFDLNDFLSKVDFSLEHPRLEETPEIPETPAATFDSNMLHSKVDFSLERSRLEETPAIPETPAATFDSNMLHSKVHFSLERSRLEETLEISETPAATFDSGDFHLDDNFSLEHSFPEKTPEIAETGVATSNPGNIHIEDSSGPAHSLLVQSIEIAEVAMTPAPSPVLDDVTLNDNIDIKHPGVDGDFRFTHTRVMNIPEEVFFKNRLVAAQEGNPANDQFKFLRTQLFQHTRLKGWNTIQISGFSDGDGASLIALNLAISIAKDTRQTTVLADLNFRKPSIGPLLGLTNVPGLSDYFLDGLPLDQIFISPGINKLSLLLAGGTITNPTELLGSPKMEKLVGELKNRYNDRYVIFDTPPIGEYPDPLVISEYIDGIILVARAHHTSRESIRNVMNLLPKAKVLGVVLNDVAPDELNS